MSDGRKPVRSAHGLFGYVVADDRRTRNALLLLRWMIAGTVLIVVVVAMALVLFAARAPGVAWLCGGASAIVAGGAALRVRRRR